MATAKLLSTIEMVINCFSGEAENSIHGKWKKEKKKEKHRALNKSFGHVWGDTMNGTVQLLHHWKTGKPQNIFGATNAFQNSTSWKLRILWYTVCSVDLKCVQNYC